MVPKVLIVDDEEGIRLLFGQILKSAGCWCALAPNASDASGLMQEHDFDLAIIDLNLPGVHGLELLKYVCTKHPHTATLVVTAEDNPLVGNAALDIGAHGYMIKPVKPNELLINVSNTLRRRTHAVSDRTRRQEIDKLVSERITTLEESVRRLNQARYAKC